MPLGPGPWQVVSGTDGGGGGGKITIGSWARAKEPKMRKAEISSVFMFPLLVITSWRGGGGKGI